jgi:integrase
MRQGEAVGLTWLEVDLAGSCVHLTESKTGRSTRPLGAPAVSLLRGMHARRSHEKLVFPNIRGNAPADLKKRIVSIFEAAGLPDVRSHDLRRSFASVGDELGYSEATIGAILGHFSRSITGRHYIRRPDEALISAATKIAERISDWLSMRAGGAVIDLRRERAPR